MSSAASAIPGSPGLPGSSAQPGADPVAFREVRDFSAIISTGFRYIRDHFRTLYRPLFFICLPVKIVASVLLGSFFHDFRAGSFPGSASFGSMFGGYALIALAYVLGSVVICEYMRWTMVRPGTTPTLSEVWRETRRHFFFYFALSLVTGAMIAMGFFLFVLPCFFLLVAFQFSYPLHAFERADLGECIGRAFSLVWGRWWMTFGLLFVLVGMSLLINAAIDIPGWLITGFGSLSGMDWMEDPDGAGQRMQWFFTLFALIGNVSALLLMPFVQVPMCYHVLSTLEQKEAPGLLHEVESFTIDAKNR